MYKDTEDIKCKIIEIINSDIYKPARSKYLSDIIKFDNEIINNVIKELEKSGDIILTSKGKIMSTKKMNLFKGVFCGNDKGFGFVSIDDDDCKDIFIKATDKNGAMHMDKVLIKITFSETNEKRAEGQIFKILERGFKEIIGTYQAQKNFGFFIPDNKKMGNDLYIAKKNNLNANNNDKVVIKLVREESKGFKAEGKVIEILGGINQPRIGITSILRENGIETDFKQEVYNEVENIKNFISDADKKNREDLTNLTMVTIDGEDSKDLDDAVSIEILRNGNFRLGVHIADVSHYVKENTELEKEAYKRGTSIYIVDRVIPMLPAKLSNGICSLNANEERLALSCFMEIDSKGLIVSHNILESVINVDRRMTYNIVNDLIINEDSKYKDEYNDFIPMFKDMETLAKILKLRRINRGSIEFDFPETKIIVDENCFPIEIKAYVRNFASSIIEEFMLVCNETVAEEYFWLEIPFVFRSHEEPDEEKLEKLSEVINNFGYFLKGKNNYSKSLQQLLISIDGKPEEVIINKMILRSLKQARYSKDNIGHFGLAAKYYCHFTSPIRRYPDLQIHRIIKKHINLGISKKYDEYLRNNIEDICDNCSITERRAESIERDVVSLKKAEYMYDKIDQEFEGIITSVTSWGVYIELENTVEGMVRMDKIRDDIYVYHQEQMMYVGQHKKRVYKLGDKVNIKVDNVNIQSKNIDFIFI